MVGRWVRLSAVAAAVLATLLIAALLPAVDVNAADDIDGYYTLDDYFALHPEQAGLSEAFADLVRRDAEIRPMTQEAPVRILIVYPGLQVSDYWRRSVAAFRGRLTELGISFELQEFFTRPGTALRQQSRIVNEGMATSPDYVVFTLDALRHRGMVERVLARRTARVILQNITTPIKAFEPNHPFLYVGFDHATGARMLADRVRLLLPDGARFAILYGSEGYVSAMRGGVFLAEMLRHGTSELVASYYVNFDRERAYLATRDLLEQYPDVELIYACSTDIALGVVDALRELGRLDDIIVNGWGGGSPELAALAEGTLDFTVMRMNDDNGVAMAEAIRLDLMGEADRVPVVFSGDLHLVGRETSEAEIERLKANAFRYSN